MVRGKEGASDEEMDRKIRRKRKESKKQMDGKRERGNQS